MRVFLALVILVSVIGHVVCNPLLLLTGAARGLIVAGTRKVLVDVAVKNGAQLLVKLLGDSGTLFSTPNCTTFSFPVLPCRGNSAVLARGQDEGELLESRQNPVIVEIEPGEAYEKTFDLGDYYDLSSLNAGTYQLRVYNHVRVVDPILGIFTFEIPMVSDAMTFTWPPSD
ncbi:hypothetical protein OPQ81_008581 [Rhizoctonia solani]|nr:hypothetical protein OPQ81_008578 [Rhizoctonia solani]KAJ1304181.1 hypothetical protein OPQ81_008581 [Rhizoctonia solani]